MNQDAPSTLGGPDAVVDEPGEAAALRWRWADVGPDYLSLLLTEDRTDWLTRQPAAA